MILGRVVGTVVATRKDDRLIGSKLLVVQTQDLQGRDEASYMVCVDTVDAGSRDRVLVVTGSSARMASGLKDCPVDAAIVGVVDAVELNS
jgi:ethanolamine utilization protein EutN